MQDEYGQTISELRKSTGEAQRAAANDQWYQKQQMSEVTARVQKIIDALQANGVAVTMEAICAVYVRHHGQPEPEYNAAFNEGPKGW